MDSKIKLWSIQHKDKLKELEANKFLICLENKYSKEWEKEYRWMANEMKNKIGLPKNKNQYPIWAWYQYHDSRHRKPDLRRGGHLPTGTEGIRIEFEKPSNEVLLSDFILWHTPLSYKSYIGKNEEDHEQFEKKLRELKIENVTFLNLPNRIRSEIEKSWQRVFDMNFGDGDYADKKDEKMIQACCWQINENEIRKIEKFIAK